MAGRTERTPEQILSTMLAHLSEHGIHALIIHPALTSAGRPYLAVHMVNYTEIEAVAILKESIRSGETPQQAEEADAEEAEDAEAEDAEDAEEEDPD